MQKQSQPLISMTKHDKFAISVLWGGVLWLFFAFLTSGVYFEQWGWKIDSWFRFNYYEYWSAFVVIQNVLSVFALGVFLIVILPMFVRKILRLNHPVRSLSISITSLFVFMILSYFFSELALLGTSAMNRVFRDVGGSLISFVISITFVVLLPLSFIVLGMIWMKKGSTLTRFHNPSLDSEKK